MLSSRLKRFMLESGPGTPLTQGGILSFIVEIRDKRPVLGGERPANSLVDVILGADNTP